MRKTIYFITLALLCTVSSCRTPKESLQINYFSGELLCDSADRYILSDCSTNNIFVLQQSDKMTEIAQEYDRVVRFKGQRVFVELEGGIVNYNDTLSVLSVERLISFDGQMSCMLSFFVVGTYDVAAGDFSGTLTLNDDYTYSRNQKDTETASQNELSSGKWHLNSALEIILAETKPTKVDHSFQIVPPQFSIVSNDGTDPLVYTKEH